jgi:hypothetical protein
MKLEEISQLWNQEENRVEVLLKEKRNLLHRVAMFRIKSGLYELKFTIYFEILANTLFIFWLIGFIMANQEFRFITPAILLMLMASFSLIFQMYRFRIYFALKSSDEVVKTQQKVGKLLLLERIDRQSLFLVIPLFAAPFLIVAAKSIMQIDLFTFEPAWLILFTAASVVIAIGVVYFLKLFPDRKLLEASEFLKDLRNY